MPPSLDHTENAARRSTWWWSLAACGLTLAVLFGVRHGTSVLSKPADFDEQWIRQPIDALIQHGWSVGTAIDFEETKGPGMIWPYGWLGALLGGSLNDLRLISVFFSILLVGPALWLASRCGLKGGERAAVAGLLLLLPQEIVLSQFLMSEPIFIFGTLILVMTFIWGMADARPSARWSPILFALVLSILLHTRVHAAAYAAAACIIATIRMGPRSWPWWAAAIAATVSRIPLWLRWGGLVSPAYQDMHQLGHGLQLQQSTYLLAACVPFTGVFLWPTLVGWIDHRRVALWPVIVGGAAGLVMALVATPSLHETVPLPEFVARGGHESAWKYLGLTATAIRAAAASQDLQTRLLGLMATVGGLSLGAMASLARSRPRESTSAVLGWWTVSTIAFGIMMYSMTAGFVFDRYLIPWCAALPILWVRWLPRWLVAAHAIVLAALAVIFIQKWLM
jgi:hypothetical protein